MNPDPRPAPGPAAVKSQSPSATLDGDYPRICAPKPRRSSPYSRKILRKTGRTGDERPQALPATVRAATAELGVKTEFPGAACLFLEFLH